MNGDSCAKCGSAKIVPWVHIKDRSGNLNADFGLTAEVVEHPNALFGGTRASQLLARVCGECGFTELYAQEPDELWAAYQNRQTQRTR